MRTEFETAKSGEFLREYSQTHFVVVSEALNIGRVKWSIVPKGKAGQGDIVFYMTTEQMLALCTEIQSGVFADKVKADSANAFPNAYHYTTGEDGCLHLNIGGGKNGCRIQMRDTKAKTNYTVAVPVAIMGVMARRYMIDTGLQPVVTNSYYESILVAFEEGRKERSKFRKPTAEEIGESIDETTILREDVSVQSDEPPVKESEKKSEPKKEETPRLENFELMVKGNKKEQNGCYRFDATLDDKPVVLLFKIADVSTQQWFEKFENAVATNETKLKIQGERRNQFIMYYGPQKK